MTCAFYTHVSTLTNRCLHLLTLTNGEINHNQCNQLYSPFEREYVRKGHTNCSVVLHFILVHSFGLLPVVNGSHGLRIFALCYQILPPILGEVEESTKTKLD